MHPNIFAFFDVDETIINIKSMFSFRDFYLKKYYGDDAGEIRINKAQAARSEERRVGKECVSTCRSGWSPYHEKKTIKQDKQHHKIKNTEMKSTKNNNRKQNNR